MAESSSVRTFSVHTPRGRRFFHLVEGSIADTAADLIVASSHAHLERSLTGQVLEALRARFGIADTGFRPLALTRQDSVFGTHMQEHQGRLFLLVRLQSADAVRERGENPLDVYREAVRTVFGSAAMLELRHQRPRSMALAVIGGRRDYPLRDAVRILLDSVLNWLTMSQSMDEVSLHLRSGVDPRDWGLSDWDREIDAFLGRTYFASTDEGLIDDWAREVASLLQGVNAKPMCEPLSLDWAQGLKDAIREQGVAWGPLAQSARRMAEWIARQLLASCGVAVEPRTQLDPMLKRLESTGKIAPLHLGYLYHLKRIGNEKSHTSRAEHRYSTRDWMHALLTVAGALQCWLDWPSPGEVPPASSLAGEGDEGE